MFARKKVLKVHLSVRYINFIKISETVTYSNKSKQALTERGKNHHEKQKFGGMD